MGMRKLKEETKAQLREMRDGVTFLLVMIDVLLFIYWLFSLPVVPGGDAM